MSEGRRLDVSVTVSVDGPLKTNLNGASLVERWTCVL